MTVKISEVKSQNPLRLTLWGTWAVQVGSQILGPTAEPQALDTTGAVVQLTLPKASNAENRVYVFKWIAGANVASIVVNGADAAGIDGGASYIFGALYDSVFLVPNATNTGWWIV